MDYSIAEVPHSSVLNLKLDPEENDSKTFPGEKEKFLEIYLKYNGEETGNEDGFIKSIPVERVKIEKEDLDQKEFDLTLRASSDITFENIQGELNDRDIDKKFDSDVIETGAIKNETNDVEITAKEFHEIFLKSESIEHEEVQIKLDEDIDNRLNEKICPYKIFDKRTLKYNTRIHKNKGKKEKLQKTMHPCPECSYRTLYKSDLKRHVEIHNSNLMLKCSKCSYETSRAINFKRHQVKHDPNIQWLHCSECSYKTHQQSLLQRHVLAHRRDAFKCTKCSYQTRTKGQLTIHQVKHDSKDKWHSCPLCPYKSYDKRLIRPHCRVHHNMDARNSKQIQISKCPECPYETGCKFRLKRHQMVHDRSNWLQCPVCVYKTRYKGDFKKHQVRHQGENADGWHRCMECPFKTLTKYDLRQHLITHKSEGEVHWFKCSQCSFKSARKANLMRHQLKHKEAQDIEWFFCYECAFKTKNKRCLPVHMSKHKKQIEKDSLQNSGQ